MSVINKSRSFVLVAAIAAVVMAFPALAEAQRGRRGRGPSVQSVVFIGPYAYPRYYYDPWYQWGPYPYPYGYRALIDEMTASVRLQVTPREAQVFVDGYLAGTVDDFDGVFQRLRMRPGGHEITVFLDGYETARESVYISAGSDRRLQFSLGRLREGERSEPPPPPAAVDETDPDDVGPEFGPRRPVTRERDAPPPPVRETREVAGRFGTLAVRVQPGDAQLFVDGERWASPGGDERVSIQLSEGRHHIEVRRDGHTSYSEDVLIRRGATFTLNVSLPRVN